MIQFHAAITSLANFDGWLPANYSRHGVAIDALFKLIFWLTSAIAIGVFAAMVFLMVRFRRRAGAGKARYIRGSTRLEMIWTALPASILLLLSIYSTRVWDSYRYSAALDDPNAARVLIIARRFNWNAIYSGADRKLGEYLVFPKPADLQWPRDDRGKAVQFAGVSGPAYLPRSEALRAINRYTQEGYCDPRGPNEFGKVFDPNRSPDGVDDVINNPSGILELPVNRPVVLEITSLDVIHDFYLPNFRVNVYAVPGLRVKVALTPTMTSREKAMQTSRVYRIDDLAGVLAQREYSELQIEIDEHAPGAATAKDRDETGWRYVMSDHGTKKVIMRNDQSFPADPDLLEARLRQLQSIGLTEVRAHLPGYWEIVCAQLCGNQHTHMEGKIYVLDQKEWSARYEKQNHTR